MNKIQDIKMMLRRRYSSRKDYRKIFKQWNKTQTGEISTYETHQMINKLGIPLNYNESRILIATSNKRGNESINMEEFINLIFAEGSNQNMNSNVGHLNCKINHKFRC